VRDPDIDGQFDEIVNRLREDDGFDIQPTKGPFRRVIVVLGVALAIVAVVFAAVVATPTAAPSRPIPSTTATTAP
jgi:hypothetical protein